MPDDIPSPRQWVRDQVELYANSGGTEGTTLRYAGLPVIIGRGPSRVIAPRLPAH